MKTPKDGGQGQLSDGSPFNVDEIDADKVKNEPRPPFGLTGRCRHAVIYSFGNGRL